MKIIERAKNILTNPAKEWEVIAKEDIEIKDIILKYLLPLALIPAIATFINYLVFSFLFSSLLSIKIGSLTGISFFYGIRSAVQELIWPVAAACVAAVIINVLAKNFKSEENLKKAFQLVIYSLTPFLVAGILMIFPVLGFIARLAAIYGFYILYLGVKPMMKTPEDQHTTFGVVSIVIMIVSFGVIGVITSAMFLWW
jgi:hypothetical protein